MLSIVIPVYRNAESIPDLLAALSNIANITQRDFNQATEVVFVVDGSPDNCHDLLKQTLPTASFAFQVVAYISRQFLALFAVNYAQG